MQLRIYISSTFNDLAQYREKVYRYLRSLGHDVIAMEDYVATDARPLQKCLQDVRDANVYVGIYAWRYGFIPIDGNPDRKSITELELNEAERLGKPRLIFILKETVAWPPNLMDSTTGENKRGARINALRKALKQARLVSEWETADELAGKVGAALYRWQLDSSATASAVKPLADNEKRAAPRDGYNLWIPGSRLRVRFLDSPSALHQQVLRLARIWSAYANIHFELSDDADAEVRVSFTQPGSWAYQSIMCLNVEHKEPTVNLGWLRVDSSLDEAEAVVLHEFGHVLGLLHEHSHPDPAFVWNKEAVYRIFAGPPHFQTKESIDHSFFTTWQHDQFPFTKPYDVRSIMQYGFPRECFADGTEALPTERNMAISAGDREFVSRLYPYGHEPLPRIQP
jgi:hypothetical protein